MGWRSILAIHAGAGILTWAIAAAEGRTAFREDFESGLKPIWKKVEFQDETTHRIRKEGTNSFLEATARASASGLAVKLDSISATGTTLSWRWKIDRVPTGGSDDVLETFDHTARLFIAFKTLLGPPRSINYVWANRFPGGKTFHHPSSSRSRFIVLQSGNANAGRWVRESRDIAADWKTLFGGETPPPIVAIGFMTDSDGTRREVAGCYDDLELKERSR